MTGKDKYLLLEALLTSFLLFIVISLFGQMTWVYKLYMIFGLAFAFYVSYILRDKEKQIISYLVIISVFGTLAWIIYSILSSSFIYKDIVLIFVKGVIFLEIILALNAYLPQYLAYMQILSIPLFMCFTALAKEASEILIVPVLLYLICWAVILKIKFYEFINKPVNEINFKSRRSIIPAITIFVMSLLLSGTLFLHFPLGKLKAAGIFQETAVGTIESESDKLDKEYYDLQDNLIERITDFVNYLDTAEDKYKIIGLLDYLIQESSIIMEVEKAERGLISYLRTPGLGLEKANEETIVILKSYVDKKIQFNLQIIGESIKNGFRKNPLNIKSAITSVNLVDKIRKTDTYKKASELEEQLQTTINNSYLDKDLKAELLGMVEKLKEWKEFEINRKSLRVLEERTGSPVRKDLSHEDEASFETEIQHETGDSQVLIPQAQDSEKPSQAKSQVDRVKPLVKRVGVIFKGLGLMLAVAIILFLTIYFITERQRNKLGSLFMNPREFILSLYRNIIEILKIFGIAYKGTLAPLDYAKFIEEKCSVKDSQFLRFTAKFEEAKYSSHILQPEDARMALADYNNVLKALFNSYNKFSLISKYCFCLLYGRPLSILKSSLYANPRRDDIIK